MPLRNVAAWVVVLSLLASGCSRLTFIRPDVGSMADDYESMAPTYSFEDSPEVQQRTDVRRHLALASHALRTGRIDDAQAEAEAALEDDGNSADAYTLLAIIEGRRGNTQQAGAWYARAAELAPTQGAALNNYGAWLCGNDRVAESLPWFDRALADDTYRQRASALANAGACALRNGQTGPAVEGNLRAALALEPDNEPALAAMAEHQYRVGNYMDARAFSQRRLHAGAATPEMLLLASQIEDKLGDKAAANRYVQRLRTEFPQAGTAQTGDTSRP